MRLEKRKKYLQISFNNNLFEAQRIIQALPDSDRILIEAGNPLIMKYGISVLKYLKNNFSQEYFNQELLMKKYYTNSVESILNSLLMEQKLGQRSKIEKINDKYLIADIKCADLADKEVDLVFKSGALAATCLGVAPIETIDNFIQISRNLGLDSIIDMINVENPILILRKLKNIPDIIILHSGVDELKTNKKQIPYYQIQKIKGNYDLLVAVSGINTFEEVEKAFFNDADIVILWKQFFYYNLEMIDFTKRILDKIS